jgi:hypothetical protein
MRAGIRAAGFSNTIAPRKEDSVAVRAVEEIRDSAQPIPWREQHFPTAKPLMPILG